MQNFIERDYKKYSISYIIIKKENKILIETISYNLYMIITPLFERDMRAI